MKMFSDCEALFLGTMLDSAFVVNRECVIINANEAACGMLGYKKKEEFLGLAFKEICPSPALGDLADSIPLKEQELSFISKNGGAIPVSANITAGFSRPDEVLIIARDNSFLKDMLERFPLYKKVCGQEDFTGSPGEGRASCSGGTVDFAGRIAAGIAHEIRNPLGNVQLSVEALKKKAGDGSFTFRHFDIILRNTEKMNHLISGLLDCTRPVSPEVKPCDIHGIINDVINCEAQRARKKKIKTTKKLCRGPSVLPVDENQLNRVFSNLVLNAYQAMDEGGRLIVETVRENGSFRVKFKDNGSGIKKSDLNKLFDPFFSTKPGGIGLGLSLCCGVISNHGGDLTVESKPGKGSVFTVSLPACLQEGDGGC